MHERNGQQNGHSALMMPAGLTRDILSRHQETGNLYRLALGVFGVLLILGIIGFVMRLGDGINNPRFWGYYAAMFSFILTTAMAAPMVAIVPRMAKGHWRRGISRPAELFAVVGLFNLLVFIPLLWVLPPLSDGRRSLWFWHEGEVPVFSPHIWASLALGALVLTGLALLYLSSLPDFAAIRDTATGRRKRIYGRLALGWLGTSKQWNMLYHRMGMTGSFYFMLLITVHFLIAVDFAMALVPGWIDALYPATHAANSLQAGVATVMLAMFFIARFGPYKRYIGLDQFWGLGKLMFALSLLWFWFWFSSFIILWYGSKPSQESVLELLMVGPYQPAFMAAFVLLFIVPMFTMMWNRVRRSLWGPPLLATSVLIGSFFDRIRVYVPAYQVAADEDKHELQAIPVANMPDVADVFIMLGIIGGSIFVYLLATKVIPAVNLWEQKELLLYSVHKRFHRTEVHIMGKPD